MGYWPLRPQRCGRGARKGTDLFLEIGRLTIASVCFAWKEKRCCRAAKPYSDTWTNHSTMAWRSSQFYHKTEEHPVEEPVVVQNYRASSLVANLRESPLVKVIIVGDSCLGWLLGGGSLINPTQRMLELVPRVLTSSSSFYRIHRSQITLPPIG